MDKAGNSASTFSIRSDMERTRDQVYEVEIDTTSFVNHDDGYADAK